MSGDPHEGSPVEDASESGEPDYEVLRILDERLTRNGLPEFYVKWKDTEKDKWSEDQYDLWVEEDQMACPELIQAFREERKAERERSRKDRSTSRSNKNTEQKEKHRKPSNARGENRESEDEDSDAPRKVATPTRKKALISSDEDDNADDDDDDADDDVPRRSSRYRCTKDKDEQSTSTPNLRSRKTELERLRLTPTPSSSRRHSQGATRYSPEPEWLQRVKRESVSPHREKELRSVVTSKKSTRSAAESRRWKKIMEKEKKKKHSNGTVGKYNNGIEGEEEPQLFTDLPAKTVKSEKHRDEEGVDGMERMDVLEDEPRKCATSSIDQDDPTEGELREGEGEDGDGENEGKGEEGREEPEELLQKRIGEEEGKEGERVKDNNSHGANDVVKEEKDSMENGHGKAGVSEEKPVQMNQEFAFQPANTPTGYDQNYKGTIIDMEVFELDTGVKLPFCRVLFEGLRCTQYILASIVEEKDYLGYRSFLRRHWQERQQARIKEGAARYRAARDAREAEEAAAAAARKTANGSTLG